MRVAIVAFDDFTDVDVFLPWDILNRVKRADWSVRIIGTKPVHTSITGLTVTTHGTIDEAGEADAVMFASGPGTRKLYKDPDFLKQLKLDPSRQLIGSMCSGALIIGALGLLDGKTATTYPTARTLLEQLNVNVIEAPFVEQGNVATAAGCLAAQDLVGWMIERLVGADVREKVIRSIQPVGKGLSF